MMHIMNKNLLCICSVVRMVSGQTEHILKRLECQWWTCWTNAQQFLPSGNRLWFHFYRLNNNDTRYKIVSLCFEDCRCHCKPKIYRNPLTKVVLLVCSLKCVVLCAFHFTVNITVVWTRNCLPDMSRVLIHTILPWYSVSHATTFL